MNNHTVQRWALTLAYDGSHFHGWQKQINGLPTIQSALELALSQVANSPVDVVVAGRTDAGVHAIGQVVHFDTVAQRTVDAWVRGVNTLLDPSIRVLSAQIVPQHFHARFDAIGRHYRYVLESSRIRSPILCGRVGWTHHSLDLMSMKQAASLLIGEQDFSSFRSSDCQAKSPIKTIYNVEICHSASLIVANFHGNAFLHNMVRNMMGALIYVGCGKLSIDGFSQLIAAHSRRLAPPTFMPDGLYLMGIDYPSPLGIVKTPSPSWLWAGTE